ncbi:MAG: O-antigen ligase family protein [Anaerolineae bacterium]|nr:O-antigen ligase family protein [Anaerolineae bacterium]
MTKRSSAVLWGLLVVVIPLAANPLSRWHFEPDKAALLVAFAGLLLGGGLGLPARKTALPLLAYTLILILATLASIDPALSLWGAPGWRAGLLTWLACAGVFLAAGRLRDAMGRRRVVNALLAGSAPVCIYGLVQRAGLDPMPWAAGVGPRIFSTFGHPNFFAAYLAMVAPLALVRAWDARTASKTPGASFWMWAALLALQSVCMVMTLSRSGWLGMAASLGMVTLGLLWRAGRRRLAIGLVIGAAGTALGLVALSLLPPLPGYEPPLLQTLTSMFRLDGPTVRVRTTGWEAAARMVADRPLLGFGPGTFGAVLEWYYPPGLAPFGGARMLGGRPHNLLLEAAVESGVPGAAAYGWLLLSLVPRSSRKGRGEPAARPHYTNARLGLFAAMAGGLAVSALEFQTVSVMMLFWLLAGMVCAEAARQVTLPKAVRAGVGLAGVVCALVIIVPDILGGPAQLALPCDRAKAAYGLSVTPGSYGLDLSDCAARAGNWEEGEAVLRELTAAHPDRAAYWRALGDYRVRRAWSEPGAREAQLAGAVEAYTAALRLSPTDPDLWLDRGMLYLDLKQPPAARADFEQAAALLPDYWRAVQAMGEYHLAVGRPEAARAAFARADELRTAWEWYLWQR